MSDIVEWLRATQDRNCEDAADKIERLRTENSMLVTEAAIHDKESGDATREISRLNAHITKQDAEIGRLKAVLRDEREQCAKIADTEPEPEGMPPEQIFMTALSEIIGATVRATRKSIANRIRARAALEGNP